MGAMGVQLESLGQSSFEQYGPWHLHDNRFQQGRHVEFGAALLQAAALPALNDRLCELSRVNKSQRQCPPRSLEEPPKGSRPRKPQWNGSADPTPPSKTSTPTIPTGDKPAALAGFATPWSALTFAHSTAAGQQILTFPIRSLPVRPGPILKRRRPDSDVDGFNTAMLGSKKRRLLRHIFTSHLSHPVSFPATHILNREGMATGDRRFLKLAAMVAARRLHGTVAAATQGNSLPPPPSPSSMMRRVAVINRFRLRIRAETAGRDDVEAADLAADAALPQPPQGDVLCLEARYPARSPLPPSPPLTPAIRSAIQNPLSPLSRVRIQARASPPGSPAGLRPTEPTAPSLRLPPSPRMRALRSPELRVTRPMIDLDDVDDLDDENVAFPTSEHESRYEDDPDDVYADFGIIFGSGGEGSSPGDEGGAEHYEDYLDDVDGIPWDARC